MPNSKMLLQYHVYKNGTFRRRELSVMRVMEGEGFSFLECYIIIYINILGDQPTSHLDRSAVVECE